MTSDSSTSDLRQQRRLIVRWMKPDKREATSNSLPFLWALLFRRMFRWRLIKVILKALSSSSFRLKLHSFPEVVLLLGVDHLQASDLACLKVLHPRAVRVLHLYRPNQILETKNQGIQWRLHNLVKSKNQRRKKSRSPSQHQTFPRHLRSSTSTVGSVEFPSVLRRLLQLNQ